MTPLSRSGQDALELLNDLRAKNDLPPILDAPWLLEGPVQSHYFLIHTIWASKQLIMWECRDCCWRTFGKLNRPVDYHPVDESAGWLPSDDFLLPTELGGREVKSCPMVECREYLVRRILSR